MRPTQEQARAVELFGTGRSLAIQAGAGTGKTSTLILAAQSRPRARGQYVAFNRAIVMESKSKMPHGVAANTAHSLAFRAVGRNYAHRLEGRRMRSQELANRLGTEAVWFDVGDGVRKGLQPGYLASLALRSVTRFCQTADPEPAHDHVPYVNGIDMPTADGRRGMANNNALRQMLLPAVRKAWADLSDPQGDLPFKHEHYLKAWQLSGPRIGADYILFDEAQDANPVMLDAVSQQEHAQLVFVGDSQQQIYEFTGAVDALDNVPAADRAFLTQSFRFGPAIAEAANGCLARLGAELRLRGLPDREGRVGDLTGVPDAILTRTNATAIRQVLVNHAAGRPVHLVGDGSEVLSFARAAEELRRSGYTTHPDLACFDSWPEVMDYTRNDPQGSELRLLVDLVEEFGTPTIEDALGRVVPEMPGVVVVSTAHKAKGREWGRVRLAEDFAEPGEEHGRFDPGEMRLLYVAVTRARDELDPGACRDLLIEPVFGAAPDLALT